MIRDFVIPAHRQRQLYRLLAYEDQAQTVSIDMSPISDDIGDISAVTWTVKDGNATIAHEDLTSNVASAVITTSDIGRSMIQLQATAGNNIEVVYLLVHAKNFRAIHWDYGYIC